MEDTKLLKKLNELKISKDKDTFIDNWIGDTMLDIAKTSNATVGYGKAEGFFSKWIKQNRKDNLVGFDRMVKCSKQRHYLFITSAMAIHSPTDLDMQVGTTQVKKADEILAQIQTAAAIPKKQTERLTLPTTAELDVLIKKWKAEPKGTRSKVAVYSFGQGKPVVNAEYLKDIQQVFQSGFAYIDKTKKDLSPLYFKWGVLEGLLMPIKK